MATASLKDLCLTAIASKPECYSSFSHLPSPLLPLLFERMRELGTLRGALPVTDSKTSIKSPLTLFRGSDLPYIRISSFSASSFIGERRIETPHELGRQRKSISGKDTLELLENEKEEFPENSSYPVNDDLFYFAEDDVQGLDAKGFPHLCSVELLFCETVSENILSWTHPPPSLTSLSFVECPGINDRFLEKLSQSPLKDTLRELWIGRTNVTDEGIKYLPELTKLEKLYAFNLSGVTKTSASHLAKLTQLRVLDITESHMATKETFNALTNLESLSIIKCPTEGVTFLKILDASSQESYPLKSLKIEISDDVPSVAPLTKLCNLEHLVISMSYVSHDISFVSSLRALKSLYLPSCPKDTSVLVSDAWDNLPESMEELYISWLCPDRSSSPQVKELLQLSRLKNLKHLSLDGGSSAITDNVLKEIRNLSNLEYFFLQWSISSSGDYTKITPEGLTAMLSSPSPFINLTYLTVSIGTLDYTHLFTTESFPNLTRLTLQGGTEYMYTSEKDPNECLLTDAVEFPSTLEHLRLIGCRVDNNNFTFKFLQNMPNLVGLALYASESPTAIENFKLVRRTLRYLKISWYDEGKITEEQYASAIGSLVNLRTLVIEKVENVGEKVWKAVGENLHRLQYLNVEAPLNDMAPINSLTSLQVLEIGLLYEIAEKNPFVRNPPSPPNVEVLIFKDFKLKSEELARCIRNMPHLIYLELKECEDQSEEVLTEIAKLPRLKYLNLSRGNVTFKGVACLRKSASLKLLCVQGCSGVEESALPPEPLTPENSELDLVKGICADALLRHVQHPVTEELQLVLDKWADQVKQAAIASLRKILDEKILVARALPAKERNKAFSITVNAEPAVLKQSYWALWKRLDSKGDSCLQEDEELWNAGKDMVKNYMVATSLDKARDKFFPGIWLKDFMPVPEKEDEKEKKKGEEEEEVFTSVHKILSPDVRIMD